MCYGFYNTGTGINDGHQKFFGYSDYYGHYSDYTQFFFKQSLFENIKVGDIINLTILSKIIALLLIALCLVAIKYQTTVIDILSIAVWLLLLLYGFDKVDVIVKNINFEIRGFWAMNLGLATGLFLAPESIWATECIFFAVTISFPWKTKPHFHFHDLNIILTTIGSMILGCSLIAWFSAGFFRALLILLVYGLVIGMVAYFLFDRLIGQDEPVI